MSVGRIGGRAALAAAGVLASVALMAAPSWAEGPPNGFGGNKDKAHLCYHEGYLTSASGGPFKTQDECVMYYADKRV